jgi:beta-lactamase superfamily II metal-dependent hydrolase
MPGWARYLLPLFVAAGCGSGLSLAAVDPKEGPDDSGTLITLQGTGFSDAVRVRLENEERGIDLIGAEIVDAETIRVAVPAGIPRGEYDLEVSDGVQEARLVKAYSALGPLRVIAVDVGQGDATLIVGPTGKSALIDVGDDNEVNDLGEPSIIAVRRRLDAEGVFAPDFFFTSHIHRDHIGDLQALLIGPDGQRGTGDDRTPKQGIFDRGDPVGDGSTETFYRQLTLGLRTTAQISQVFDLGGDVTLRVIAADGFVEGLENSLLIDREDENQRSLVLLLEAPRRNNAPPFRAIFTGDLSGGGIGTFNVESFVGQAVGAVDVLRAGHHGSNTSTSIEFLQSLKPKAVLISVGQDNPFCHPDNATMGRLSTFAPTAISFLTTAGIVTPGNGCGLTADIFAQTPAEEVVIGGDIVVETSLFESAFDINGRLFE